MASFGSSQSSGGFSEQKKGKEEEILIPSQSDLFSQFTPLGIITFVSQRTFFSDVVTSTIMQFVGVHFFMHVCILSSCVH